MVIFLPPTDEQVHLAPRETTLCGLLVQGKPNKLIAHEMGITEGTVKVYLSRMYQKLQVPNRTGAALWWLKNEHNAHRVAGLIDSITKGNS